MLKLILKWILKLILGKILGRKFWPCELNPILSKRIGFPWRLILLPRIDFPGRPICIHLPPGWGWRGRGRRGGSRRHSCSGSQGASVNSSMETPCDHTAPPALWSSSWELKWSQVTGGPSNVYLSNLVLIRAVSILILRESWLITRQFSAIYMELEPELE